MITNRAAAGGILIICMGIALICFCIYKIHLVKRDGFRMRADQSGELIPRYRWISPKENPNLIKKYIFGVLFPIGGGVFWILIGAWLVISPSSLLALLGNKQN